MRSKLSELEGTDTSTRHYHHTDERGSVIALSNNSGALTDINRYDEYGIPASSNAGRFQYTGQQWLAEVGMYHYRNRIYSPTLGRFLQTDPIGIRGGINLYAYVGNNPINFADPSGEKRICVSSPGGRTGPIEKCVDVDGNGNGSASDNDLNETQADAIRDRFFGFITTYGGSSLNPTNLSSLGKDVRGTESDAVFAMTRVVSQFIGYIATYGTSQDNNATANLFRQAWDRISYIRADRGFSSTGATAELASLVYTPSHVEYYIQLWGGNLGDSLSIFNYPPDLARAMFHEPMHFYSNITHDAMDAWARAVTTGTGLGVCRPTGGFPGC